MTGFALVAYATNLMRGFENDSLDARFSVGGLRAAPDDVIVVDIDMKTFTDLNTRWERWPPDRPRRRHRPARRGRRPRDRLRRPVHRASADPAEDNALIEAVGRAGYVTLATTEVDEEGRTNVFGGEEVLREYNARARTRRCRRTRAA